MMHTVKTTTTACRGCTAEVSPLDHRPDPTVVDMFTYCTNIQITDTDNLPRLFCSACVVSIVSCHQFVRRARRADATLREVLSRRQTSVIVQRDSFTPLQSASVPSHSGTDIEDCTEVFDDSMVIGDFSSGVKFKGHVYLEHATSENVQADDRNMYALVKCEKELKRYELTNKNEDEKFMLTDGYRPRAEELLENVNKSMKHGIISAKDLPNKQDETLKISSTPFTNKKDPKYIIQGEDRVNMKDVRFGELSRKGRENISKMKSKNYTNMKSQVPSVNRENNKCPLCPRVFITKTWLNKHVSSHSDGRFICNHCSKEFSHRYQLTQHEVTHSPARPFACAHCAKRYKLQKQLNFHLHEHQERPPLYQCDHCNASFKAKRVLTNHIVHVHAETRTHLCHLCGAAFSQSGNLAVHMRAHSGARPQRCGRCAFRCSSASSLRRHERRHDGARPYVCGACARTFRDAGGLSRHKRTHTGELPYRCGYCSQAFIDSWKRKSHVMKLHHVAPRAHRHAPAADLT